LELTIKYNSDGLEPLGIAFAYSGAIKWTTTFSDLYDKLSTDYVITDRTDPGFILFKLHCWRFIAWIETMKETWTCACSKSSLTAIAEGQSQLSSFDISESLLKWTQKAVTLIQEVRSLKEQEGSFELNSPKSSKKISIQYDVLESY
jgi:hypothetical protein